MLLTRVATALIAGPLLVALVIWGPSWGFPAFTVLLVALVLTPNGMDGLMMPVRAVGQFFQTKADLRTTISELVPLQKSPNSLGLTITAYRISLVWGIVWIIATAGRVSLLDRAVGRGRCLGRLARSAALP